MTDREWREAADMKPSTVGLALVLLVGFLLRVWHLGSGVPFAVGIDEPAIMTTVLRILKSGDFNPHFFEYPTGYIYVQLGGAVVQFLFGAMDHAWRSVQQVGPSDFYLWGRAITAVIGTATIALLYQAGLRWGARHALLAAGLLAVFPWHVRESHFVLTDVPLTFCVALTLLLSLRAYEKPTFLSFVLAGASAGLAAGIKYNGLMAVSLPIVAAIMASAGRSASLPRVLTAMAACVVMFFITTPYAVLDMPGFLNGFGTQAAAFLPRQRDADVSWLIYLKHLRLALGWPASLLAAAGLILAVVRSLRGPGHGRWVLLVVFPAVFFFLIIGWTFLFARYALPMVPFICLWVAIATISGVSLLRRFDIPRTVRTTLIVALTLAALLPPLVTSVQWLRGFGVKTTQALAWEWIRFAVWPGSLVVSEAKGLDLPPEHYRIQFVKSLDGRDPAELAAQGVQWVILSSDAWGHTIIPDEPRHPPPPGHTAIISLAQEMRVFLPTVDHPGPEIHILRLTSR